MTSELTLGEFAVRVRQLERRVDQGITRGMRESLSWFLQKVKRTFGEYQDGAGPFPTWAPLSPNTLKRKESASGYPRFGTWPAPLVRSADLRGSYGLEIEGHEGVIASDSDYAAIHETGGFVGNRYIPQRSTLGLTFVKYEKEIFERYNRASQYEIMDLFGMHSVIFHDDDLTWDSLDDYDLMDGEE